MKLAFTVERIVQNEEAETLRKSKKSYTIDGDRDDIIAWFEDTYADGTDSADRGYDPNTYFLTKITDTGFIIYKLTIKS